MSRVSAREFFGDPDAVIDRVEQDETAHVTRQGEGTAAVLRSSRALGRYADLAAQGLIRLNTTTTADLDRLAGYEIPGDQSPLDVLLAIHAEEDR